MTTKLIPEQLVKLMFQHIQSYKKWTDGEPVKMTMYSPTRWKVYYKSGTYFYYELTDGTWW